MNRFDFKIVILSFLIFILGKNQLVVAQNNHQSDSIIQISKKLFDQASQESLKSKVQSKILLERAIKINDKLAMANVMNSLGWSFYHQGTLDSSIFYLQKSKIIFNNLNRKSEIIKVAINLSEVYVRKGEFKLALNHLLQAEKVNNQLNDIALQTDLFRQFGIVYRELKEYKQSSTYFIKAMNGFKLQNDLYRYVTTGISLSILYKNLNEFDKGIRLLNELNKTHQEAGLSEYLKGMIFENLGEQYYAKGDFLISEYNYNQAYGIFKELNLKADVAYEAFNRGKVLVKLNRIKEAELYLLESERLSDSLKMINYSYEATLELSKLYQHNNNWESAFNYSQKASSLKDSLDIQEKLMATQLLAKKYESAKKEQEIQLLKKEQELTESKEKRNKIWLFFLLILSVGAFLIVWLLWNKIKLNKKLEFEKRQNKIAGDIEDERILNQFTIALFGKNNSEDIFWEVAQNCIRLLHFEDCVVYLVNNEKQVLEQYAAAGPKNPTQEKQVFNPIEIPFSKGIVGAVFQSGKSEIVPDTAHDSRYIIDDHFRQSEITVPILIDGKVFGIIDSEHSQINFFTERHLTILERVASICSERISKLIIEEKLRLNIARDLHDEVGSTITSITILSGLVLNSSSEKHLDYLQKINDQSQNIMECMSDIIWAINPNYDTFEQTVIKMKEFSIELIEQSGIRCEFITDLNFKNRTINPEERKYIFLIFKEAINNAVKYSESKVIKIAINQDEEYFNLVIQDDGRGFNPLTENSGNGLKNMQERAHAIQAFFEIHSIENKGTTITLKKRISHD
jgi:signal transduction histidine kinase